MRFSEEEFSGEIVSVTDFSSVISEGLLLSIIEKAAKIPVSKYQKRSP